MVQVIEQEKLNLGFGVGELTLPQFLERTQDIADWQDLISSRITPRFSEVLYFLARHLLENQRVQGVLNRRTSGPSRSRAAGRRLEVSRGLNLTQGRSIRQTTRACLTRYFMHTFGYRRNLFDALQISLDEALEVTGIPCREVFPELEQAIVPQGDEGRDAERTMQGKLIFALSFFHTKGNTCEVHPWASMKGLMFSEVFSVTLPHSLEEICQNIVWQRNTPIRAHWGGRQLDLVLPTKRIMASKYKSWLMLGLFHPDSSWYVMKTDSDGEKDPVIPRDVIRAIFLLFKP